MAAQEDEPPVTIFSSGKAGLPDEEVTFADIAKSHGYTTGIVGKWHVGLDETSWGDQKHGPKGHGFDYFFGLPFTLVNAFASNDSFFTCNRIFKGNEYVYILISILFLRAILTNRSFFLMLPLILFLAWFLLEHFNVTRKKWWGRSNWMWKFLNSFLMENMEVVEKPISLIPLADKLVMKSTKFIESAVSKGKPFLLYHAFAHVHTPLFTAKRFEGKSVHGPYGDTVLETDDAIGRILNLLERLKIADNTFVYFTSYHGGNYPQDGERGGWNHPFRGGKTNGALEGGIRVPGIVKWPARLTRGLIVSQPTSMLDILPTIADIVGHKQKPNKKLDGVSMMNFLTQKQGRSNRTLFHYCGSELMAVREVTEKGKTYKLTLKEPRTYRDGACPTYICRCHGKSVVRHKKPLLYDIEKYPDESRTIDMRSEEYQTVAGRLMMKVHEFKAEMEKSKTPSQYSTFKMVMPRPWLQPFMNK